MVRSKVIPVFGVVSMVLSSVIGGEVEPRVIGVGSTVSSMAHIERSYVISLLCETGAHVCVCVCVLLLPDWKEISLNIIQMSAK